MASLNIDASSLKLTDLNDESFPEVELLLPTDGSQQILQAPNASGTIALVEDTPYKVYTALLSQTGASAPTIQVLENTLGATLIASVIGTGYYQFLLTGTANIFTINKTYTTVQPYAGANGPYIAGAERVNDTVITVRTTYDGTASDDLLSNSPFEIRVYN